MDPEQYTSEQFDADYPELTESEYQMMLPWWECGMHAQWRRVWRDGVDVTDDDPNTWPAIWRPEGLKGRTRSGRKAWHTAPRAQGF